MHSSNVCESNADALDFFEIRVSHAFCEYGGITEEVGVASA